MRLENFPDNLLPRINSSLPFWYTNETKNQVRDILRNGVNDQAPNRTIVEWITIDAKESKDLDDWIWAERRKDWWYTIFISIADPTEFIPILSPIDIDAMNKWTSIYLGEEKTIYMLPRELATDIVSLNDQTTRLSQTAQIDYDNQMNVINSNFYESKFINRKRFDYEEFRDQYFYEESPFHDQLRLQDEIAKKLREKRLSKWIIEFDEAERWIWKDNLNWKNIASRLIEEFMVAANVETAKFQMRNYPETWVYRNHMVWLKWKEANLKQLERAYYSNKMEYHFWLKEDNYTHFTSPMRRYLDFILHRQLKAFLRSDEQPYTNEDLRKIVNRYLNQQLNRIYFLEKWYHFEEKVMKRYSKVKENCEQVEESINQIKDHIKTWVKKWLKLPTEIREEIIDTINNSTKRWDWMWIIWTYLLSEEKEIIKALRERVLREWKYTNMLNSIQETRLVRWNENKIFSVIKDKWLVTIKINRKVIVKNATSPKEAITQLFDYALKK